MPWQNFLLYNALGAAFWAGFWSSLFYLLGKEALRYGVTYKKLLMIILVLLVTGVLVAAAYRWRMTKK